MILPLNAVYAFGIDDTATININSDETGKDQGKTLNVNGNVYALGEIIKMTEALINMNFTNADSRFHGWSSYKNGSASTGTLNFTFSNGALWEMTKNSKVTNLVMKNDGIVDMRADGNDYSWIYADTLSGQGGTFKEDIDVRSMEADRVYVGRNLQAISLLISIKKMATSRKKIRQKAMVSSLQPSMVMVPLQQKTGKGAFSIRGMNFKARKVKKKAMKQTGISTGSTTLNQKKSRHLQ